MKKLILILANISMLAFMSNCKKKAEVDFKFPPKPASTGKTAQKDDLRALLKSAARKPETFTVNATTGGTFTSSKGIVYTIAAEIFLKKNGEIAQGPVQVTVSEITEAKEMILNDMPTNAIENPRESPKDTLQERGRMLESFGEIKVDATQGSEELDLKPSAEVVVEIPQKALPEPIMQNISIPIWSPVKQLQTTYGHDYENRQVALEKMLDGVEQTGVIWTQEPEVASHTQHIENGIPTPSLTFGIGELRDWRNCDVLVPVGQTTTVLGFFTNVFNDSSSTEGFGGIQANMLFFKKKGDNVLVKLYNHILNAPAGKKGLLSYQNSFGVGTEGTFLALVSKEGKFYAQKKTVTIGAPEVGKNYVGINFTLQEVSSEQMFSLINSMSNE